MRAKAHPIHPADLDSFRRTFDAALEGAGYSQRGLERRIGCSTGTISKVRKGRARLTKKLLCEIAQTLAIEPHALVAGTSFETLLEPPPAAAEPKPRPTDTDVAAEHGRADRFERALAAKDALLDLKTGECTIARRDLAAANEALKRAREELDDKNHDLRRTESVLKDTQTRETGLLLKESALSENLSSAEARASAWEAHAGDQATEIARLRGELRSAKDSLRALAFTGILGVGAAMFRNARS